jgi:hypothetical protein
MRRDAPGSASTARALRCAAGVDDAVGVGDGRGVAVQVGDALGDAGTVDVGEGKTLEGAGVTEKVKVDVGVEGIGVVVGRGVLVLVAIAAGSSVAVDREVGVVETGGETVRGGVNEGTGVSVDLPVDGEDEVGAARPGFGEGVGTVWRWGFCAGVAHAVRASEPRMIAPPTRSARAPCPGFRRGYRFMLALLFGERSPTAGALRRHVPCKSAPQGRRGPGLGIEQVAGGTEDERTVYLRYAL